MERFFNTAGPINRDDHYHIDPLSRLDLDEILRLIAQKKYFVLHAPRQTGKTSLLLALMDLLNKQGTYTALYVNLEAAQAARENVKKGMQTILSYLGSAARRKLGDQFLDDNWEKVLRKSGEFSALYEILSQWAQHSEKPVVLFLDEIDSLVGDTLITVLRQLRSGYADRPSAFPQSIILCGVRDVRDYRIHSDKEKTMITGGSAFNIKAKSLRLGNLNPQEVKELYLQHTEDTGQIFEEDVFQPVWELTGGQPWLVNALAYEVCFDIKGAQDRKKPITGDLILQAKENLILRRETHLDQLGDKLKEDCVRRVLEPILACHDDIGTVPDDDVDYVFDLGLIRKKPQMEIANSIYREVIPRQLTYTTQLKISQEMAWYLDDDGRVVMDKLLTGFQPFFREHFESWVEGFSYKEAGVQLLVQAFLQRLVTGGGMVDREYGLGRKRTDLMIIWPHAKGTQRVVLELKLRYGSLEKTIEKGLEQTAMYMDACGTKDGYLLVFDRTPDASWESKIFKHDREFKGTRIAVYGM